MTTRVQRGPLPAIWTLLLLVHPGAASADPVQGGALAQTLTVAEPVEASPDTPALHLLPLTSRISLLPFVGESVPGVQLASDGLRIHGGQPRETQLLLDGARVRQLRIPMVAAAGLEILGAGYGAEYADITGGVIALRTSEATSARLGMSLELFSEAGGTRNRSLAVSAAAPLTDQLSMRAAVQVAGATLPAHADPEGILGKPEDPSVRQGSALVKLTWRPGRQQQLHLLAAGALHRRDRLDDFTRMPEAQPRFDDRWLFSSLRWQGGVGVGMNAGAQVSVERSDLDELPVSCAGGGACDTPPIQNRFPRAYYSGNHAVIRSEQRTSLELAGTLEGQWPGPWSWLTAGLRLRPRLRVETLDIYRRTPSDTLTSYSNGIPDSRTFFYSNNPLYQAGQLGPATFGASSRQLGASLEAPVVLHTRLHLVPGAALVSARAETGPGTQLTDLALAPVLRVAWQPLADRHLWLRASSSRRADMELASIIERSQSFPISRHCLLDPSSGDFTRECFLAGATPPTVGLRCGPQGLNPDGTPCAAPARVSRVWEHTLGIEGVIHAGLHASLSLVERRTAGGWDLAETNLIWNAAGTNILGYRNGLNQQVTDLSANGDRRRRYRGATVTLADRTGPFDLSAAYSWMRTDEDRRDAGEAVTLSDGGRSFVHLRALLDFRHVVLGLLYSYAQGDQYNAPVSDSPWDDYRSRRGVNPGQNLNDPVVRRPLRLLSQKQAHLHLRARARHLLGVDLDVFVEGLELLERDPAGTLSATGALVQGPPIDRWWRLGAELRY